MASSPAASPTRRSLLQRSAALLAMQLGCAGAQQGAANTAADTAASGETLFGFGHSHIYTLMFRYAAWRREHPRARAFEFRQLLAPEFQFDGSDAEKGRRIGNRLLQDVETLEQSSGRPVRIFTCFAGNEYHGVSLVRRESPFDFVDPQATWLPLAPNAEVRSYESVRDTYAAALLRPVGLLDEVMRVLKRPLVYVSPLPPVADAKYLVTPASPFKEALAKNGASPPAFRLKFWRLQIALAREACARNGWRFLPTPAAAVDGSGYLRPEACGPDGVHASPWYADLMLDELSRTAQAGWMR